MTRSTGKYRPRWPKLEAEELAVYRSDPSRERDLGITDYVVCRECGRRIQYVGTGHLRVHNLTSKGYGYKWPGAPLYSPLGKERRLVIQRNWVESQDADALKDSKHTEYMAHREKRIAAATQRNKEHRDDHHAAQARYRKSGKGKVSQQRRNERRRIKLAEALHALEVFNKARRPATRAAIFAEAHKLHASGCSWSKIAKQLLPREYKDNPAVAAERLRKGSHYYTKQT